MMAAINSVVRARSALQADPAGDERERFILGNSRLAGPPPLDLPPSDRLTVPFSKRKFTRHRTVACSASKRLPRVEIPVGAGFPFGA